MNRRDDASAGRNARLMPILVLVVLLVLALILLFIWSPWDRTDANGPDEIVPEGPGPESELTPVSWMIGPAAEPAWFVASPALAFGGSNGS